VPASHEARGHAGDFYLRKLVFGQGCAKHLAVPRIGDRSLQAGTHQAQCAPGSLDAAAGHPCHGEVETPAQPAFLANHIGIGHEEILEGKIETVHPAIADRGNRLAGQPSSARLLDRELMPLEAGFFDQQHAQATVAKRAIGIGASHHHQQSRLSGKGAPALGAVEQPAALRRRSAQRQRRHVRTEIGLGNRNRAQRVTRRNARQPVLCPPSAAPLREFRGG